MYFVAVESILFPVQWYHLVISGFRHARVCFRRLLSTACSLGGLCAGSQHTRAGSLHLMQSVSMLRNQMLRDSPPATVVLRARMRWHVGSHRGSVLNVFEILQNGNANAASKFAGSGCVFPTSLSPLLLVLLLLLCLLLIYFLLVFNYSVRFCCCLKLLLLYYHYACDNSDCHCYCSLLLFVV